MLQLASEWPSFKWCNVLGTLGLCQNSWTPNEKSESLGEKEKRSFLAALCRDWTGTLSAWGDKSKVKMEREGLVDCLLGSWARDWPTPAYGWKSHTWRKILQFSEALLAHDPVLTWMTFILLWFNFSFATFLLALTSDSVIHVWRGFCML